MAIPVARPTARTTLTVALLLASSAGLTTLASCETCSASSHATAHSHATCGPFLAVTVRCPMPCCTHVGFAPGVAAALSKPQVLTSAFQDDGGRSPVVTFLGIGTFRTGSNILSLPAPARARGAPPYLLDSSFLL